MQRNVDKLFGFQLKKKETIPVVYLLVIITLNIAENYVKVAIWWYKYFTFSLMPSYVPESQMFWESRDFRQVISIGDVLKRLATVRGEKDFLLLFWQQCGAVWSWVCPRGSDVLRGVFYCFPGHRCTCLCVRVCVWHLQISVTPLWDHNEDKAHWSLLIQHHDSSHFFCLPSPLSFMFLQPALSSSKLLCPAWLSYHIPSILITLRYERYLNYIRMLEVVCLVVQYIYLQYMGCIPSVFLCIWQGYLSLSSSDLVSCE